MKRAIIVHGWEGNPSVNWFPWLKSELDKIGVEVLVPEMPNSMHPDQNDWVAYLSEVVGVPDEQVFLVGHSLGGITILKYLETLTGKQRVGGVMLAAAFPEAIGLDELKSFFTLAVDYEKVRSVISGDIFAFQSDDDKYVPLRNGELLRDNLRAEVSVIHHGGHLNADAGYQQFPELLTQLKKMMGL